MLPRQAHQGEGVTGDSRGHLFHVNFLRIDSKFRGSLGPKAGPVRLRVDTDLAQGSGSESRSKESAIKSSEFF